VPSEGRGRRRPGLAARLLVGTVLVAVCSIAATAWLTVRGTEGSIRQSHGQLLAAEASTYDTLLGYAATHPDWDGVAPVVADLQRRTGLRVDVVPGGPGGTRADLPRTPSALVDPLAVDPALKPDAGASRIDPRAVGPFRLTEAERDQTRKAASDRLACLRKANPLEATDVQLLVTPSGRAALQRDGRPVPLLCGWDPFRRSPVVTLGKDLAEPETGTEKRALAQLTRLLTACVCRTDHKVPEIFLSSTGEAALTVLTGAAYAGDRVERGCLVEARRSQLEPYVAPSALLYIRAADTVAPASGASADTVLPATDVSRVGGVVAVVLLLTVLVSALLARRVIVPVRALTSAVERMGAGEGPVRADVRSGWEIAELARAFNRMSEQVETTERLRAQLVNDVSHELRNPLNTIRGWLIAAQDGVAALDRDLIASLLEESAVLQQLVDDLRDLALADAGQLRLEIERVDVAQLLAQVAAARGGCVAVEAPDGLVVHADQLRLRQALGNLLVNARRHTPPDGRIALVSRSDGDDVVIEVADTGSGIAPEDVPHVFDRFWRADRSRTRSTGGSGLGLAIVRQLVEAHEGSVQVASVLGAGTTVTVRLPAADAGAPGNPRTSS
jgi:two-component system, OmpR family, sensor histidine kinase BaeS